MRAALFNRLFDKMAEDPTIAIVIGDMGLGLIERFQDAYPDRVWNVGIAERNMIAVATGLANVGYRVFCYSVSNFVTGECYAAIRNEACLNQTPLILIGTTVGYDNAALGPTHHCIEDWASVKALPGMTVFCPSSVAYAETLVDRALAETGPVYIRVAKGSGREGIGADCHFAGRGTLIITAGGVASEVLKVRQARKDIGVMVLDQLHPLSPDLTDMRTALEFAPYDRIIVVEDQVRQGLYASICELQPRGKVEFVGPDSFDLVVGATPEAHWKRWGMTAEQLLERIG